MSIEKAIADQTAAIEKNTEAQLQVLAALQALAAAGGSANITIENGTGKTSTVKKDTKPPATDKGEDADSTPDPIYWHIPGTEEFGSVDTEAEWKKLKKAKAKAVKIPESKYQTLVEAASSTGDDDVPEGEYSERIMALIDDVPEEPSADDITDLFKKYLPKDLEKAERDARADIIKPILAAVKAPKASAVKDEDRRDVMVEVIKGIEVHLEETGQVSDDEDEGLV